MNDAEYEVYIGDLFDTLKRKNPLDEYRCIPIVSEKKEIVGFLKPITFDYERMYPDAVSLCSKWRRENPTMSNSIFKITDERTKKWLDNLILGRKDRILFFIDDLQNRHVGHCAYSTFDFKNRTGELDAYCRGEECSVPKIMRYVDEAMINWAAKNLMLENLQLRVNEDNKWSVLLHKRSGFEVISRIPLYRRELNGEIRWDEDETKNSEEAERFYLLMQLRKEKLDALRFPEKI